MMGLKHIILIKKATRGEVWGRKERNLKIRKDFRWDK